MVLSTYFRFDVIIIIISESMQLKKQVHYIHYYTL